MREACARSCRCVGPLLALGQLVACHAVYPYEAHRADGAVSDSGGDGTRDARGRDLARGGPRDLGPPADGIADATGADDGGCVVPPTLLLGGPCASQCLAAAGDQDCDGLPDERDPWPASCNAALLADELSAPAAWQAAGGVAWSCGAATLADGATLRLANATFAPTPAYLTEVRLTVDQIVDAQRWLIGVRSAVDGQQLRGCRLFFDASLPGSGKPLPNVDAVGAVEGKLGGISDATQTLEAFAPGEPLLLQLWSTPPGQHHCRAMTLRDGQLRAADSDSFVLVPDPTLKGRPCSDGFCLNPQDLCEPCKVAPGDCCTLNVPLFTPGTIELFAQGVVGTFTSVHVLATP